MAIPNKINITGRVYIKYIDDLSNQQLGDILLLLNDDAINPVSGDYENTSASGYIKAKIYDGLIWQNISIGEFCQDRENKFAKRQRAIDSALLCQDIIKEYKGQTMFRTYRGHFTMEEYQQGEYITKANRGRK
jgi:hypothetical protein